MENLRFHRYRASAQALVRRPQAGVGHHAGHRHPHRESALLSFSQDASTTAAQPQRKRRAHAALPFAIVVTHTRAPSQTWFMILAGLVLQNRDADMEALKNAGVWSTTDYRTYQASAPAFPPLRCVSAPPPCRHAAPP